MQVVDDEVSRRCQCEPAENRRQNEAADYNKTQHLPRLVAIADENESELPDL